MKPVSKLYHGFHLSSLFGITVFKVELPKIGGSIEVKQVINLKECNPQ